MSEGETVAEPKSPDWDLAQVLYSQGVRHSIISEQAGVTEVALRKRIQRKNWVRLKDGLTRSLSMQVLMTQGKPVAASILTQGEHVKNALSEHLYRSAGALRKLKAPKSYRELKEQGNSVKPLAETANLIYGYSSQQSTTMLSVEVLSAGLPSPDSPALDIPAVPLPLDKHA